MYLITIPNETEDDEMAWVFDNKAEYEEAQAIAKQTEVVHIDHGLVKPDSSAAFRAFLKEALQ